MDLYTNLVLYVTIIWVIFITPTMLSVIFRTAIHNMRYVANIHDVMAAVSVFYIIYEGYLK